jgi:hypothetical protein
MEQTKRPNYDLKHKLYSRLEPVRVKSRDLYDGAVAVKAKGPEYLYRTKNETDEDYALRLKRAVYDNWAAVVIRARLAVTWRKGPVRDKFPSDLEPYRSDVDGHGTGEDTFFKSVNESASVEGLTFVLVDKTRVPVTVTGSGEAGAIDAQGRWWAWPFTRAAETALGIRPMFKLMPSGCVFDWKPDGMGGVEWVTIALKREEKGEPGFEAKEIDQRLIWRKDSWTLLEMADPIKNPGAPAGEWVTVDGDQNPLGEVPLVPFYGIKEEEWMGSPVTKDVLDHCLSIYNKFSDRDVSEFLTNNPIPYFIGGESPTKLQATLGTGIFVKVQPQVQAEIGYMEPSGSGVEASRSSERDLIRRIAETALSQAKRDTAQVQDDDSLKEEAKIFNSSLVSVAVTMEQGERKCWELFWRWMSKTPTVREWPGEVHYSRDFDDSTIDTEMIKALSDMVDKSQLPVRLLLEILKKGEVLPEDLDTEKIITEIEDDLNRRTMPGFGQNSAVPASSGGGQKPPVKKGAE